MIDAAIVDLGRWGRTLVASVQGKGDRLRFTRAAVRGPELYHDFAQAHGLVLAADFEAVPCRSRHCGDAAFAVAGRHHRRGSRR
jgi:hypothetical protein